jgi:hypothetical protein
MDKNKNEKEKQWSTEHYTDTKRLIKPAILL